MVDQYPGRQLCGANFDIFGDFSDEQRRDIRETIIEMVTGAGETLTSRHSERKDWFWVTDFWQCLFCHFGIIMYINFYRQTFDFVLIRKIDWFLGGEQGQTQYDSRHHITQKIRLRWVGPFSD